MLIFMKLHIQWLFCVLCFVCSVQDELTKGVSVAEEEARKRSEYMKAQRDKLLAAKKRERDAKVQEEDSRLGRAPQQPASKVNQVSMFRPL